MQVIVERQAALDVHKEQVTACVRFPGADGARVQHVEQFSTTVRGLVVLGDWLAGHGAKDVAMEATGVYWKPVWYVLEGDFDLMLVNARHVKQVPGRKTDVSDASWLCQLGEAGLLRASFVPEKPIRDLRQLTRYRRARIAERQREANRLHKALEDTGIKLDCVATNILGVSGRLMLNALVAGTTDPNVLAQLAKGKLRKKIPALREALEGRFEAVHAFLIGEILTSLDTLDEQIERLSTAIEERISPFSQAVDILCTIPGVGPRTAEVIIAEIGPDMSVFPSAGHLASWAGQCPGNAPATTNPPANAGPGAHATARNGSTPPSKTPRQQRSALTTRTSKPSTDANARRSDTAARSGRSNTRCCAPAGTCSPTENSTPTSAATTSPAVTPNAPPAASSPNSNASATPSHFTRWSPDRYFPLRHECIRKPLKQRHLGVRERPSVQRRTTSRWGHRTEVGAAIR